MTYDPYSRSMQENPYPSYDVLRNESPCAYNPKLDFHALFRFEDEMRRIARLYLDPFATVPIRFGSRGSR